MKMPDITDKKPTRSKLSISAMRFILENCVLFSAEEWEENDMIIVIKVHRDIGIQTFLYSKIRWGIVTGELRSSLDG
jgi:hypothetical protein